MNRLEFFKALGKGVAVLAAIPLLPILPKSIPIGKGCIPPSTVIATIRLRSDDGDTWRLVDDK